MATSSALPPSSAMPASPTPSSDSHPEETAARLKTTRIAESLESSSAHLSLYIGLRETAAELGLEKTNLWIYPHHDHDQNVGKFIADLEAPLPLAYISFPSAKDPDFERRCPGRATIEVVTLASYDWFKQWEDQPWRNRGPDYEALKAKLTDRMLEPLYKHCPQVEGKIDIAELSTPLSTRHFAGYAQGEIYGLAATPERFAGALAAAHRAPRSLSHRCRRLDPRCRRGPLRRHVRGVSRLAT